MDFEIFFNKIVQQNIHEDQGFLFAKTRIIEINVVSFQTFYLIPLEKPFGDGWINCNKDEIKWIEFLNTIIIQNENYTMWERCAYLMAQVHYKLIKMDSWCMWSSLPLIYLEIFYLRFHLIKTLWYICL